MPTKISFFISLLFASIALAPSLTHLLELPHKVHMSEPEYLVAQQLYRGWPLPGIAVTVALLSTLLLCIQVRKQPFVFTLTLVAFSCMVVAQITAWLFIYPANRKTDNWTTLPGDWMLLRVQWEYSHAAAAVLNLLALVLLIAAVVKKMG